MDKMKLLQDSEVKERADYLARRDVNEKFKDVTWTKEAKAYYYKRLDFWHDEVAEKGVDVG